MWFKLFYRWLFHLGIWLTSVFFSLMKTCLMKTCLSPTVLTSIRSDILMWFENNYSKSCIWQKNDWQCLKYLYRLETILFQLIHLKSSEPKSHVKYLKNNHMLYIYSIAVWRPRLMRVAHILCKSFVIEKHIIDAAIWSPNSDESKFACTTWWN